MELGEAISEIQELLLSEYRIFHDKPLTDWKCELVSWPMENRSPEVGFRVAEIDFTNGTSGESFMQVDQDTGLACFYAERAVLSLVEDWEEDYQYDEMWRLIFAVFGEKAALSWQDRTPIN